AWGFGLLALFWIGKGMSVLIIRGINRSGACDPVAIPQGQRVLRKVYRILIVVAALYYYVSLIMLVVIVLSVPGSVFLGLALTPRLPGTAMWGAVPLAIVVLLLGIPLARTLRARSVDQAPGRPVTQDEAPQLWELIREVADRVGTRPVDE